MNLAAVFGLVTLFSTSIPNVGATVSAVAPLPFIVLDPAMLMCVLLPVGLHFIVGSSIEPRLYGDALELHPGVDTGTRGPKVSGGLCGPCVPVA